MGVAGGLMGLWRGEGIGMGAIGSCSSRALRPMLVSLLASVMVVPFGALGKLRPQDRAWRNGILGGLDLEG